MAALSIGEFQLSNLVAGFLTRPYPVVLLQAFYGATGFACAATVVLLGSRSDRLSCERTDGARRARRPRALGMSGDYTIALEGVTYVYPGTDARRASTSISAIRARRVAGRDRRERLRQVHAAEDHRGFRTADARPRHDRRQGRRRRSPPRLRNIGIVFQAYTLFPHMLAWENVAYPLKLRGQDLATRRRRLRWRSLDARRPDRARGESCRRNCPAASSSAWRWRARWCSARRRCCSTSRSRRSTPRCASKCATRSAALQRQHGIATHAHHPRPGGSAVDGGPRRRDAERPYRSGRLRRASSTIVRSTRDVARFVGHANLWTGRVIGPDERRNAARRAHHARRMAASRRQPSRCWCGPRRVRARRARPTAINSFPATVTRDRFLGSFRRFDLPVAAA